MKRIEIDNHSHLNDAPSQLPRSPSVYICICNQVNDRQIAEAVRGGARSLEDLRGTLDVATCCGKCGEDARRVIENTLVADRADADACLGFDATA